MDLPTLSARNGRLFLSSPLCLVGDGGVTGPERYLLCSFHHFKTSMWPCELAASSADSVNLSGRPESNHQSKAWIEPERLALSMASVEYSLVRKVGEVRQYSSISILPNMEALWGRNACPKVPQNNSLCAFSRCVRTGTIAKRMISSIHSRDIREGGSASRSALISA